MQLAPTRSRTQFTSYALILIALLLAVAFGIGLWLNNPRSATRVLSDAASQRPVNKTDQLIWSYQETLRQDPANIEAYAVLGAAYIQKTRETGDPTYYAKAESVLNQALQRDPQNVEALIGKGSLALSRHDFRAALALGEQARVLNPTVPRIYGVIADAQTELGMYDDAVATLQQMVDMRPDLSSYSRASYARELHGDMAGAIEAMTMAVRAGGPNSENTEWTRVQLGNLYFNSGDLAQAESQYAQSLARLPDYVPALVGVARVRAAQGRTDAAVAMLQQVVARMPLPEYVVVLGEIEEAAGRTDAAATHYALVRAMQQLFKANGVDVDLELALFDADHGDPQQALTLARTTYQHRPSIKAADTLAWALYKAGQPAEARRYATEALRLGTQDATLLYHAGMIDLANGDHTAATQKLQHALAINPYFSPLYAPLARQALK